MKARLWKRTLRRLHRKYRKAMRCPENCQMCFSQSRQILADIRWIEKTHPEVTA